MRTILFDQKKIVFFIFFIFLVIGFKSINDYGVSSDEYNSRVKGFTTLKYIGEKISPELTKKFSKDKVFESLHETTHIKYYGVVYEAPAAFLEVIFGIEDKNNQFKLRHYLNFIIFFVSLIFFYKLLNNRFDNWKLSILGVLMIFLSPRIFANSFYNNKDIIFLSFFIFSIYFSFCFIEKDNNKNIILSSLFSALAIDVRIAGIVTPAILTLVYIISKIKNGYNIKSISKQLIKYLFFLGFFTTVFWPYLWSNPIKNFYDAFVQMSSYPHKIYNLFKGEYLLSTNMPIDYLPTWIIYTTPIIYIIFFIIGFIYLLKIFFTDKKFFLNQNQNKDFLIIAILLFIFFSTLLLGATFYNGWRQFYFLYPLIIYISIYAIFKILNKFSKKIIFLVTFIFIISFSNTSYWMIKNHPHQYVYFNFLAGKNFNDKFEMDYWGLSYKENIEFILDYQKTGKINLFNISHYKLYHSLWIFSNEERNRINLVRSPKEADYIITNYYYINPDVTKGFKNAKMKDFPIEGLKVLKEVKVDGVSINTIFKK